MANEETPAQPHDRIVARTDGAGALVSIEAGEDVAATQRLALSVDLVAAALARLGEARGVGRPRSALLVFDGAVMAIGPDAEGRNVVVIGEAKATHGLVLSHLNRVLAGSREGGGEP